MLVTLDIKIKYYIFEVWSNFSVFVYLAPNILAKIVIPRIMVLCCMKKKIIKLHDPFLWMEFSCLKAAEPL